MDRQDIHAPDPQGFIPFIHNYCDRRCERCRFMRQCRVGALEADDVDDGPAGDIASERPEDLKERLMKLMGLSAADIAAWEAAKEADAASAPDPAKKEEEAAELAEYRREQEELDQRIDAHPLNTLAMDHMHRVHAWVEERADALKARGVELHPRHGMDIAVGLRTPAMQALSEAVQLIIWDHTMIPPKVNRALHGLLEDGPVITDEDLQSDHNGTARLCLELVNRSRKAWDVLCDHLPEERTTAQPIKDRLDRMVPELHKAFPRAQEFIRPGFDAPRQPG